MDYGTLSDETLNGIIRDLKGGGRGPGRGVRPQTTIADLRPAIKC